MSTIGHCRRLKHPEPSTSECELLMWDGRLDNRTELIAQFWGSMSANACTSAVVRAVYQRDGVLGLKHLVGDWSVVIRDARAGLIVLASDFAGIRPLYYAEQDGMVLWSTSLDALVERTRASDLDERYVAGFMLFGGYPNRTPYEGIRSVPAGHAVCFDAQTTKAYPFWELPPVTEGHCQDERHYTERCQQLFEESVAARLVPAHPVLAELSGGFDSSSIVCMASRLIRGGAVAAPALTTISYTHPGSLDLPFIRAVESLCRVPGEHVSLREAPLFSTDCEPGALPQGRSPLHRAVVAVARGYGAKTLLTGQGGDLVMGNWIDDSLQVARFIRRGRFDRMWDEALAWSRTTRTPAPLIIARAVAASLPLSSFGARLFASQAGLGDADLARGSLQPELLRRTGLIEPLSVFSTGWKDAPPERRGHLLMLTITRELRPFQPYARLKGLDYAHPFLHRPLVEFLLRVPAEVLCGPGRPRLLMRRSLSFLWPSKLRARRSKGLFTAPYHDAFRPFAAALLRERRWHVVERGWVERESLTKRLERLARGLECRQPQLRQILLLENWMRHRFDRCSIADVRLAS